MDVYEFSRKYLYPYKVKGSEIIPRLCPFCAGGSHGDIETFALNTEKLAYVCLRGSCGATGSFNQLLRKFGESPDRADYQLHRPPPRNYKKPPVIEGQLSKTALDYIAKRKISKKTLDKWKVTESNGRIVFNYYDANNELVFVKYRTVGKDGQWTRESDTMPILYGMWLVDTNKPMIIVEGEWDALAVSECGIDNVVSVPSGSKDFSWIENCWDWLQQIDEFILFGDNDTPGREMTEKLIVKLGEDRCRIGQNKYKDANELLYREGTQAVREAIDTAKYIPKMGLVDVADITYKKKMSLGVPTGFKGLDRKIEDAQLGELSIWTGKNGEGKSTILGQVILEALDFGVSVFTYSGELTKERFQQWINTQAAGQENLESYKNQYGDTKYSIKENADQAIKEWYRGRFFLYDNAIRGKNIANTSIIDLCKYAAKRHDCLIYVIDNLMTSDYEAYNENDYYLSQSKFVGDLVNFAKTFRVHVHLVAHPKKKDGELDKDSVAGKVDITNRADNVFSIERIYDSAEGYDAVLKILKNRKNGELGKFRLKFDSNTKRFYQINAKGEYEERKPYRWAKYPQWVEDAEKAVEVSNLSLFSEEVRND